MRAATVTIATELLRLGGALAVLGVGNQFVVNLVPVPDGVSRARAAAKFWAEVTMPWLGAAGSLSIVDTRGYPVGYTLAQFAGFLARTLPSVPLPVQINIVDASKVPARWTDARLASLAGRVAALDVVAIRAAADAKRETVEAWAEGERRTRVLTAAAIMDECAATVEAIRAGEPFGPVDPGGGGGEEN